MSYAPKKSHMEFPYFTIKRIFIASIVIVITLFVGLIFDVSYKTNELELKYIIPSIVALLFAYRYLFFCIWYIHRVRTRGFAYHPGISLTGPATDTYKIFGVTSPYISELKKYDVKYARITPAHRVKRYVLTITILAGFIPFLAFLAGVADL
jgi:hypothetical protein